jgi:5-methyltetrahydrofolate--homocysteine methyltransferase
MRVMKDVIGQLEAAGLRDKVRVMIGGAPTSQAYADEIKADAHCKDAFQAIDMLQAWRRDSSDEKAYG